LQKWLIEKQVFKNTRFLRFSSQNTAFNRFKMSVFGAVWMADLRIDRTVLPILEKNPCFGYSTIPRYIFRKSWIEEIEISRKYPVQLFSMQTHCL